MNAQHGTTTAARVPATAPQPAAVLTVVTAPDGRVITGSGHWPGGVHRAGHLHDLVHEHNHDLLDRVTQSVSSGARVDHAVGVQVRSDDGWSEAVLTAVGDPYGVRWSFMPLLADPMRALVKAVTDDRDIGALLDAALRPFDDPGSTVWASVHFDRTADDRYAKLVANTGRDTFRRAVEAAVAGDTRCVWDGDRDEDELSVALDACNDGLKLAGPHAGIGAARLIPISGPGHGDAACLVVWSESPGTIDAPEAHLLMRRVTAAVTLVFRVEQTRIDQRTLATRDGLTGLWNRAAFFAQLEATKRQQMAVVSVDIDNFHEVNERRGHPAGDDLLVQFADRLRHAMRPGDTVARMASDEFAILCPDVQSDEAASAIAERVLAVGDTSFVVGGEPYDIGVSVGIAVGGVDGIGVELFGAAEKTRREVKADSPGTWLRA